MKVQEIEVPDTNQTELNSSQNNSTERKIKSQGTLSPSIDDDAIEYGQGTPFLTLQNVLKTNFGSGIIALPLTFYLAGPLISVLVFLSLTALLTVPALLILKIRKSYNRPVIEAEMIDLTLGSTFSNSFIITVGLGGYGGPISYLLFFFGFFEYVFYDNLNPSLEHKLVYISIALCLIIPLTLINDFSVLARYSGIANVKDISTMFCLVTVMVEAIVNMSESSYHYEPSPTAGFQFQTVTLVMGVSMYAYMQPMFIPSIANSMKDQDKFNQVFFSGMVIVVIGYLAFPLICALGFQADTQQIILFSLKRWTVLASIVQISYSLTLAITYPIILFSTFQQIESSSFIKAFISKEGQIVFFRRSVLRLIQVLLIGIIAIFVPSFTIFLSFVGPISILAQGYIFPMAIYLKKRLYQFDTLPVTIFYCVFMAIGTGLSFFVMIRSFIGLIENKL